MIRFFRKLFFAYTTFSFILKVGRNNIGSNARIRGGYHADIQGYINIGNNFTLASGSHINPIGRNVESYIRVNKNARLLIGHNVGVSSACVRCDNSITIGDNVKIGALTIIMDSDAHSLSYLNRRDYKTDIPKSRPIKIGNDVLIGANSIICKGVEIGERSIVGAGSVVTHSIPADEIWAGNPARKIRSL